MHQDRTVVTTLPTIAQNINETLQYIDLNSNLPSNNSNAGWKLVGC